jgi:diacylglycerol kinase (ATP)
MMRVMVLFNPVSGKGRATAAAEDLAGALARAGHVAICTPTRLEPTSQWLEADLASVDLVAIAGGDGAVRMALNAAITTKTPIYHFPCGTENLFAREFGMTRSPQQLVGAITKNQIRNVDVGRAGQRRFLLMLSVGYDAEVVHDLASRRGKSISHWTYAWPVLSQLLKWRPKEIQVTVDGSRIDGCQRGFVVVANSRQYGWRLNPAGRASMSDGLLDVAFFPARTRLELAQWALRCRRQSHLHHPQLVYRTGRSVTIRSAQPQKFQLDGDAPEIIAEESAGASLPWQIDLSIDPGVLQVLVP